MKVIKYALWAPVGFLVLSLFSFRRKSITIEPVKNFDQARYLGLWYEIARLDFKFERGLNNVTANYSLRSDGKIKVDNKGYDYKNKKWKQSIGKAKPAIGPTVGKLKVSFFGPFYADYNIVALDPDYQYALIIGSNTSYMWILSRNKTVPENIKADYLEKAKKLGVKTEELIWVHHD